MGCCGDSGNDWTDDTVFLDSVGEVPEDSIFGDDTFGGFGVSMVVL